MTKHRVNYDTVVEAVNERVDWHMYNSYERGIPVAKAITRLCGHCGTKNEYAVFSYGTVIYTECSHCGRIVANGYRYSVTTRKLQNILAWELPAMKKALEKAYNYEKEQARIARNERRRDRRMVENGHGTLTSGRNAVRLSFPDSEDLKACSHRTWNETIAAQYEESHS